MSLDRRAPAGATAPNSSVPTTGSALGTGLLILGAALGALIVLWLLVQVATGAAQAGGFVFGLFFLVIIALPLVGAGWYLRQRGAQEVVEAETFAERRSILDDDRVVRRELGRELDQRVAGLLEAVHRLAPDDASLVQQVRRQLQEVSRDVRDPGYDATTWLESTASRMDATQIANVRRYDDLVMEEARRLADVERQLGQDPQAARRLEASADLLSQHVREREQLLGRGKSAAALSPQEMLAAGTQVRRQLATPLELRLEDAVSYEGSDYLVRGVLTYFAGGRSWNAYQLHDGKQERWLEVRRQGAETAWYAPRSPVPDQAETVAVDGESFTRVENGSASVGIQSGAGTQEGVFVDYARYSSTLGDRLLLERWPDGPRALLGRDVAPEDLQLWTKPAPEL